MSRLYPLTTPLFVIVLLLVCVGMANLNSATLTYQSEGLSSFFKSQLIYHGIGLVMCYFISHTKERFLQDITILVYILSLILLVLVLVLGSRIHGSLSWLEFGGVRLQPSEFAKVALILFLSFHLAKKKSHLILGFRDILPSLLICGVPLILVLLQKDLGTSLFFGLIFITLTFLQGVRWQLVVFGLLTLMIVSVVAYHHVLEPYQQNRIVSFLNPELDSRGSGYHIVQSKIAVGSGKALGRGYMKGKSHKLKFLPERHTDFVFPVLAEEWGFVGSTIVLLLYLLLFLSGIFVASRSHSRFAFFLAIGLTSLFFWHVFINLGGVLGLIPLTGVPLPFLSYGGSSTLTLWIALGFLFALKRDRGFFMKSEL